MEISASFNCTFNTPVANSVRTLNKADQHLEI